MDKLKININMLNKNEVLDSVKELAKEKAITKEELEFAYSAGSGAGHDAMLTKKVSITEILYYLGGAVVFLGISILVWENWYLLGFPAKVLATFGSAVAAYFIGVLFSRDKTTDTAASAFFLISALVAPLGISIILDNAGYNISSYGAQSFILFTLLAVYLISYFVFRKNIFTVFSILFGTLAYFSLTSFIVGTNPIFDEFKFYEYRTLVSGIAYILLGYAFSKNEREPLKNFLYSLGIFGFLGAALSLGGWSPDQNLFWELIYPVLVFGVLFLSVYIKSNAFLLWGTIFLMAYILKITSEYFTTGLGWPLALVFAGFAMIAAGYLSVYLKRKYLKAEHSV